MVMTSGSLFCSEPSLHDGVCGLDMELVVCQQFPWIRRLGASMMAVMRVAAGCIARATASYKIVKQQWLKRWIRPAVRTSSSGGYS